MGPRAPELGVGIPITYAKDQPQYRPLAVEVVDRDRGFTVVTRWALTAEERSRVAAGEDVYLAVLTFGRPLQPLMPAVGADAMRAWLTP